MKIIDEVSFEASLSSEEKAIVPHARALARAVGPLLQANDDTPAALACAYANWELRKAAYCYCSRVEPGVYWRNPMTGSHGWMCPQCRGITQVG